MLGKRVVTALVLLAILLPSIFVFSPWVWGAVGHTPGGAGEGGIPQVGGGGGGGLWAAAGGRSDLTGWSGG